MTVSTILLDSLLTAQGELNTWLLSICAALVCSINVTLAMKRIKKKGITDLCNNISNGVSHRFVCWQSPAHGSI